MISGLLKLWMSSKAPPIDTDPTLPCLMKPIMIYSSKLVLGIKNVLGMKKLKRPI